MRGDEPVDDFKVVVDSSQRSAAASESSEVRVDASEYEAEASRLLAARGKDIALMGCRNCAAS